MATKMKTSLQNRTLERRVKALEQAVEELRKLVGDLKYEVEQMREE